MTDHYVRMTMCTMRLMAAALSNVVDTTYGPQTRAGIEEFGGVETFQSGVGNWLVYDPPVRLPCTHVTHIRGA